MVILLLVLREDGCFAQLRIGREIKEVNSQLSLTIIN
jgi:hypothetical protein|tara:strand:- start:236 stop:346 length:111 start_codon:yes stop_codon:yes gene_type:complete